MMRNKRGAALGIAIIAALITGIAAYTILIVAMSQARQSGFTGARAKARYAAEAALVWAHQQLSLNPNTTFPITRPFFGISVTLTTVPATCSTSSCPRQIIVNVAY